MGSTALPRIPAVRLRQGWGRAPQHDSSDGDAAEGLAVLAEEAEKELEVASNLSELGPPSD